MAGMVAGILQEQLVRRLREETRSSSRLNHKRSAPGDPDPSITGRIFKTLGRRRNGQNRNNRLGRRNQEIKAFIGWPDIGDYRVHVKMGWQPPMPGVSWNIGNLRITIETPEPMRQVQSGGLENPGGQAGTGELGTAG